MSNKQQKWTETKPWYGLLHRMADRWVDSWPKTRRQSSRESPQQRRERAAERLALLLVWGLALVCMALTIKALIAPAGDSGEWLDILERVWPYLLALLGPIIHYYFGRNGNKD